MNPWISGNGQGRYGEFAESAARIAGDRRDDAPGPPRRGSPWSLVVLAVVLALWLVVR